MDRARERHRKLRCKRNIGVVRIDVRDNRYRMTFADVRLYLDGVPRAIDYTDRDSNERRVREHLEQLANSLDQYLTKPKEDF